MPGRPQRNGALFGRPATGRLRPASGLVVLPVGALLLVLGVWSCSKNGGTGVTDDGADNPPGAVSDLALAQATPGTVTLRWTAPHGGSPALLAHSYDLRYAAATIKEENWAQAVEVAGEPGPAPPGTLQSMLVAGLPPDTTLCFALKVRSQTGLWSALSNGISATLPPEADLVFPDSSLDAVIRGIVNKPQGPLRLSDVAGITGIQAAERGIASLEGLQNCPALSTLDLRGNRITGIGPLAGMTQLTSIVLSGNQVDDLAPLAAMTRLGTLMAGDNRISDLTPLHGMEFLNTLYLNGNRIENLAPLTGCTRLNHLFLAGNNISDLTPLAGLAFLANLQLSVNAITDLSPLVANSGLGAGDEIWVEGNPLSDPSRNEHIPALRARGAVVHDR